MIFWGYELASSLKVNFGKSKIFGLNTADSFLATRADFLSCYLDKIPFKFLGIKVGSNPMRVASWREVIDFLNSKLSRWKGRFFFFRRKVTLLNSTLNSVPIYMISFFKAPKVVLKVIISIQANFLWQRVKD